MWIDSDGKGGWKVPSGKGQRLIVVHAGEWENGWKEQIWCLHLRQTQQTTMTK